MKSMLPESFSQLEEGKTFVGIDFGTSTTVVSVATYDSSNRKIKVKPIYLDQMLEDGTKYQSEKIPSVIAWFKNILLVGEGASNLKYTLNKGKNIWYSFKMEIGEDLGAKYYDSEVANIDSIKIRNPKDCVRIFFMYLRMLIERYCTRSGLSLNINYAISIPASFEANQRRELMEALETNGMTVSRQSLIDEPNAAFISYINDSQDSDKSLTISSDYNPKVLVFDFGGGTCDISILEIGKSVNGFYSKNLSISKFTKLGGDDIDRYLTYQYLLPRFLAYNNFTIDKFRSPEIKIIAAKLYKVAEKIKINVCKSFSVLANNFVLPSIKDSDSKNTLSTPVRIETTKGVLSQEDFYITNKEITEAMSIFTKDSRLPLQRKRQEDYNNIFIPIKSAIEKAHISIEELDYVLLIGGSSKNPYIQEALHKYFEDSELLILRDLQTHVSKGTAIHSLLMNGMNKCLIQPITSEPIFVITKDTLRKVLIPAGTIIPSDTVFVDDLVPSRDNQEAIELPICVGSQNKMLFNLKITRDGGFPINAEIKLALELTADKLLLAQANCLGVNCMIEPQNPFANKELTTEERIVLAAERQANLEAEKNGGVPTKQGLISLRQAYNKAGNAFRAAETYELQLELYPNPNSYNEVGVLYSNSGNENKAVDFYERALANNPNEFHPMFNLGHCLINRDPKRAETLLRKAHSLDPSHAPSMIALAGIEERLGHKDEAQRLNQEAYDILYKKWKGDSLRDFEYSWLESVAQKLGLKSVAQEVRLSKPKLGQESYYNEDNLTRTRFVSLAK